MNAIWRSLVLAIVFYVRASAQTTPLPFVQPIGGTNNVDWTIVNYVDLDSTAGFSDYTGGNFTYNGHTGIDMTLPNFAAQERGVGVFAAGAGTVSFVQDRQYDRCTNNCNGDNANYIQITHTNGLETLYYHLARNSALVKMGDTVTAGQQIALVGSSGFSSDAHLHFEVHKNGAVIETYQNPSLYWTNPLPYASNGVRAIDSGFTRQFQDFTQLRDRPSDNDVVFQSDGANQEVDFWAQIHSVAATDAVRYRLVDPNGAQWSNFPVTPTSNNWGWTRGFFTLPTTPLAGVWTASVLVNGTAIRTDQFTVVAAPQIKTWTASSAFSVLWSTAENWSGNAVPSAGQDVRITHSDGIARAIINDQQAPTLKSLWLDLTGPGTQRVNFYTDRDMSLIDGLIVGDGGRATFNQTGGRITTANPDLDMAVGWHFGSDGIYNMSSNSSLHVSRGLYIGAYGFSKGTFNQSSGTTTSGASTVLGNEFGAVGTYNLSGGTLNVGDVLYAGSAGQGDINIMGRSQVLTHNGATLGYYAGGRGTVTLDGERTFWDEVPGGTGPVVIGREGTGTLNIRNHATVSHATAILGESGVGNRTGNVNVDTAGRWTITGALTIADNGVGNINVTNGGIVNAGSIIVGGDPGSQGTVVVDSYSGFSSNGDMYIGFGGTGRVTVSGNSQLYGANITIGLSGVGRLTVVNGGTTDTATGGTTTVGLSGTLDGDYIVGGRVRNYGVVYPSSSPADPGALYVSGNYVQETQGALKIALASASVYSQLNTIFNGTMALNGILNITTIGGFAPGAGQSFDILNSNSISGTFQTLQLPTLGAGLSWNTSELYTTGVISVVGSGVTTGDFNSDGRIDAGDYIVWRKTAGTAAGYQAWRANFGRTVGSGDDVTPIPEPGALLLSALCIAIVAPVCRALR